MKSAVIRVLVLSLVLVSAGCQSQVRDEVATRSELAAAEAKFSTLNEKTYRQIKELTDQNARLEVEVAALKNRLATYDVHIRALNDQIAALRATGGSSLPPVTPSPDPGISTEEAIRQTDDQLVRLKAGAPLEEVAASLRPIAKVAAPKLCEALKESLRDIDFTAKLEAALSKLPPADLRIPLGDALKDRARRHSAARVVGGAGDRELSRLLEPFTADADLDFCYLAGHALVQCRNRAGVPALLRALRAEDKHTRFLAVRALRSLNAEDALGYDFTKPPEANAAALKAWEEWFERNGPRLFE